MTEKEKRTGAMILAEIHALVGTIDGMSTADAMRLGALVQEYGNAMAGETVAPIMMGLLEGITKKPERKPWEAV